MWNLNRISNVWTGDIGSKRSPAVLAGLDLGTSKTAVIIAQACCGFPQILGSAEVPSIGVAKGCITSPEAAAKAIMQAMEQALRNSGAVSRPLNAYVSFNGDTTAVKNCLVDIKPGRGSTGPGKCNGFMPVPSGLAEGDSALFLIPPRDFPGRSVFEVEAGARVVTAPTNNIDDISRAVRLAGLKLENVVFGPVAAAEVLLTPAEKEFGTILIDIGAGTTSVSIFDLGAIRETVVFPLGGEHLTSDLAIGLHVSLNRAEEILYSYGLSGSGENKADLAGSIIEARLLEILNLTGSVLKSFQYPGLLPGGAVFCGGVTMLEGFAPFAENILKIPLRVGNIRLDGHYFNLTLANALGLIKYGAQRLTGPELKPAANCEPDALMTRLIKWLQGRMKNESRL